MIYASLNRQQFLQNLHIQFKKSNYEKHNSFPIQNSLKQIATIKKIKHHTEQVHQEGKIFQSLNNQPDVELQKPKIKTLFIKRFFNYPIKVKKSSNEVVQKKNICQQVPQLFIQKQKITYYYEDARLTNRKRQMCSQKRDRNIQKSNLDKEHLSTMTTDMLLFKSHKLENSQQNLNLAKKNRSKSQRWSAKSRKMAINFQYSQKIIIE